MCPTSPPAISLWPMLENSRPAPCSVRNRPAAQSVIDDIDTQGGITDSGVVYGQTSPVLEYVTEDWFRQNKQNFYTPEEMDNLIRLTDKNEAGLLADEFRSRSMSDFALDHLTVLEEICPPSTSRAAGLSPPYTQRTIMETQTGTVIGLGWGTPSPSAMWRRASITTQTPARSGLPWRMCRTGPTGWSTADTIPGRGLYCGGPGEWCPRPGYRYYGSDEFILNDQTLFKTAVRAASCTMLSTRPMKQTRLWSPS